MDSPPLQLVKIAVLLTLLNAENNPLGLFRGWVRSVQMRTVLEIIIWGQNRIFKIKIPNQYISKIEVYIYKICKIDPLGLFRFIWRLEISGS